jgi:5-methylthioadenosine/S-adenosylhomocysteine deaminase
LAATSHVRWGERYRNNTSMKTLLERATVVTMNTRKEILYNAHVLIEDSRITTVGSVNSGEADQVIDCRGKILIPGLVSAHSHLTGLLQRGLWDENSFESWSQKSTATEKSFQASAEDIYTLHCASCVEFIRHGVTTVLNMFTVPSDVPLEFIDASCRALQDSGIRGILALSVKDQSPDNQAIVLDPIHAESWVSQAKEAAAHVSDFGSRISFMLAPSAPQRCSDNLLMQCKELAENLGVGIHTHLAETKSHADVARNLYGEPMVNHLEKIGFLGPHLSVAHAIWLDEEEIDILGRHRVNVVHNPSSNMKLGSGVARVKKMLDRGIVIGLGADSVNAGTVYSIFEQMKLAILLPRAVWKPEHWISPDEAFQMGCMGGGRALLLGNEIGSIEEGKKADLVVLKPSTDLLPTNNLIAQLALSESSESVETVFVDGAPILLNGRVTKIDEDALLKALSSLGPRISAAVNTLFH